jgi:hypothetical protein
MRNLSKLSLIWIKRIYFIELFVFKGYVINISIIFALSQFKRSNIRLWVWSMLAVQRFLQTQRQKLAEESVPTPEI